MEGRVYRHHHWQADEPDDETAQRQTASLAGIAIILLLLVGGLFLVQQLRFSAALQDCVLSGRQNCDVVVARSH
jgi:hypothetical protein